MRISARTGTGPLARLFMTCPMCELTGRAGDPFDGERVCVAHRTLPTTHSGGAGPQAKIR
jgi:hypothetical protein